MKRKSRLRPLSIRRSKEKQAYKKAYQEQDRQMIEDEGGIFCASCGRLLVNSSGQGVFFWGHAHNLPVGHYVNLEADPENFKPRCQSYMGIQGCHNALDDRDFIKIKRFVDLPQIMAYRFLHDINAYNQFVTGLRSVGCFDYDYK